MQVLRSHPYGDDDDGEETAKEATKWSRVDFSWAEVIDGNVADVDNFRRTTVIWF